MFFSCWADQLSEEQMADGKSLLDGVVFQDK